MKIEQIYTGCLAQGAYYIQSDSEVAIIDPLREAHPYLERAKADRSKIKYVFETHFHADFVSGHLTISEKTGSVIVYGPNADPGFDAHIAKDGEEFRVGKLIIKALHTPGHTMESTTYLLIDENGKDIAIFTGDTLFLGDVGRPDLAQKSSGITQNDLAGILYDSLRNKIMPLADDVIVYPAHGAGSACGKNMMKETVDTLGNQKKVNYSLRDDMSKEEFIKEVTDGLLSPPSYFSQNIKLNKQGYKNIDKVLKSSMRALSAKKFEMLVNQSKALIIDVRGSQDFAKAHIPGSVFIGLDGSFAPWVGELVIDTEQPIVLIVPQGREEEAVTRLARVGFDNTLGYLKGGIQSWEKEGKETDTVLSINASELEMVSKTNDAVNIFDVRKKSEYSSNHIEKSINTPLKELNDHLSKYSRKDMFYIHCQGGYRSMIACSILKSRGIHNICDIKGGFSTIKQTAIPLTPPN